MKTLFAGFCLVFTTLFSCQQKEGQFKSVSVDDFSTLIANPEVQLLDVRTVAEYSEGHVPPRRVLYRAELHPVFL